MCLRERRESGHAISFNEVALVFIKHAREYYVKNGEVTREAELITEVLAFVRKRQGRTAAEKLGPVMLKNLREKMITELGWSRKHLNKQVGRIVRMYKWAVENELIEHEAYAKLDAVGGLKKGRTIARETEGVNCVDDSVVDQTIEHLPEVVADMVRLQRLTGARPGEVCTIRPGDIDRSDKVWIYTPSSHKTEHHEKGRAVLIGPKGQQVLAPYLLRAAEDYCFTPRESEKRRFEKLAAERKTPRRKRDKLGEIKRAARVYAPCYNTDTYRHAIQRTCKVKGIPKWSPNQLRHTAATDFRKRFGLEAAQVICGHGNADVTQVYAERDFKLAVQVIGEVG